MSKRSVASKALDGVAPYANVKLAIEYVAVAQLKAPARAVRDHSQRQIKQLGRSLKDFGAIIPGVVDRDNVIIVGAGIIEAARQIGMAEFPVVRISHLDDHQLRLFRIAHTKLTEGGTALLRWPTSTTNPAQSAGRPSRRSATSGSSVGTESSAVMQQAQM